VAVVIQYLEHALAAVSTSEAKQAVSDGITTLTSAGSAQLIAPPGEKTNPEAQSCRETEH